MRDLYFDRFTRRLAKTVDRREALKVFAGGALGGLMLTYAGCDLPWGGIGPIEERCEDPESDLVTSFSLEAAEAALATGATEVKLSPQGCRRYRRTFSGNRVASEAVLIDGQPVLEWQHAAMQSTGRQDADRDGFNEWTASVNYTSPDHRDYSAVVTTHDPDTRLVVRRQTETRTGDLVQVRIEETNSLGQLVVVSEYVRPPYVNAGCTKPCPAPNPPTRCNSTQCDALQRELRDALSDALNCAKRTLDDPGMEAQLLRLAASPPKIECQDASFFADSGSDGSNVRARTYWGVAFFADKIFINRDMYCGFDNTCKSDTLIHEALHVIWHNHNHAKEHSSKPHQVERIYACSWLCTRPRDQTTRLQCQVCLDSKDKCDQRCSSFAARPPAGQEDCFKDATDPNRQPGTLGWQCGNQWFETRGGCAAGCSGGAGGCSPDRINCRHLT